MGRWPDAIHHGMSWRDPHPDHRHVGEALNDAWRADRSREVRFWQFPIHRQAHPIQATEVEVPPEIEPAAQEYRLREPADQLPETSTSVEPDGGGRYGIGYRSVGLEFTQMFEADGPWYRRHGPSENPEPAPYLEGYDPASAPVAAARAGGGGGTDGWGLPHTDAARLTWV